MWFRGAMGFVCGGCGVEVAKDQVGDRGVQTTKSTFRNDDLTCHVRLCFNSLQRALLVA